MRCSWLDAWRVCHHPEAETRRGQGRLQRHAKAEIRDLMQQTDALAEIQNTLRVLTPVILDRIEAVSIQP